MEQQSTKSLWHKGYGREKNGNRNEGKNPHAFKTVVCDLMVYWCHVLYNLSNYDTSVN